MRAGEIVSEIMKSQNVKVSDMCYKLKIKSNVFCNRLVQKNMSVKVLDEMLRTLDYKIMVVPRGTKVDGGYDVE